MDDQPKTEPSQSPEKLRTHIRKLILMRETGPKSAAWHRARVQAIWRLQRRAEQAAKHDDTENSHM